MKLTSILALSVALAGSACSGSVSSTGKGSSGDTGGGGGDSAGSSGAGGDGGSAGSTPIGQDSDCKNFKGSMAPPSPMLRLTNVQYNNTLRDLLPGISIAAVALPSETRTNGFFNNTKTQAATANTIEIFRTAAMAVSTAAMAQPNKLMTCTPTNAADEATCGHSFIADFGKRAFRRPMTSTELTNYKQMFDMARSSYGFNTAVQLVVQAFLQSPHFLYRVELGGAADPQKGGLAKLNSYEMASRLSYLLWDSMPDAALLASADANKLDNAAGIEAEARRLLADPKAHTAVSNFHRQWISDAAFDKAGIALTATSKSTTAFPKWNDGVVTSLRANTEKYLDHMFWDVGKFADFYTDTHTYVDANTAWIYGVSAPSGSGSSLVEAPNGQRAGILTQAGLMAGFAHATMDSPVFRGYFVMNQLLCSPPAAPPANVPAITPLAAGGKETTRDHYANIHDKTGPACAGCHESMDSFGFTFEHYDAVGQWRTMDNGLPVNAKTTIDLIPDLSGDVDGSLELGAKLAKSAAARTCMAATWFQYSLGLGAGQVDTCQLSQVMSEFAKDDYKLTDLLVAVVKSDAFHYKLPVKP